MEVGAHQCPGVDREAKGGGDCGEAIEEGDAVGVIVKDGAAVDAASDNVMESIGGIKAWSAWHVHTTIHYVNRTTISDHTA
jgi:hypothetical protein